jgi:hypothetical protein
MRFIVYFSLLCALTACCTKKDCEQEEQPYILLEFLADTASGGFTPGEMDSMQIIRLDKTSLEPLDSVRCSFYTLLNGNYGSRLDTYTLSPYRSLRESAYLIAQRKLGFADTLTDISYTLKPEKIKCNSCFPFGDGSATVVRLRNFSYRHNGQTRTSLDSLLLKK